MTVLVPIQYETKAVSWDAFERPSETRSECDIGGGQAPYLAVVAAVNVGCLMFAIFQAYKARHLTTEFGESKYVFKALQSTLLVGMVGVPVLLLANDNTNASTFVASSLLFVTCTSILLFIFVPKIRFLKKMDNKDYQFRDALATIAVKAAGGRADDSLSIPNSGRSSLVQQSFTSLTTTTIADREGLRVYGNQTKAELIIKNEELMAENARLRRRVNNFVSPDNDGMYVHTSGSPGVNSGVSVADGKGADVVNEREPQTIETAPNV